MHLTEEDEIKLTDLKTDKKELKVLRFGCYGEVYLTKEKLEELKKVLNE